MPTIVTPSRTTVSPGRRQRAVAARLGGEVDDHRAGPHPGDRLGGDQLRRRRGPGMSAVVITTSDSPTCGRDELLLAPVRLLRERLGVAAGGLGVGVGEVDLEEPRAERLDLLLHRPGARRRPRRRAPRRRAVAIACRPATPAPSTSTRAGVTVPAAVISSGKKRGSATRRAARRGSRRPCACDDSASIAWARVMRGIELHRQGRRRPSSPAPRMPAASPSGLRNATASCAGAQERELRGGRRRHLDDEVGLRRRAPSRPSAIAGARGLVGGVGVAGASRRRRARRRPRGRASTRPATASGTSATRRSPRPRLARHSYPHSRASSTAAECTAGSVGAPSRRGPAGRSDAAGTGRYPEAPCRSPRHAADCHLDAPSRSLENARCASAWSIGAQPPSSASSRSPSHREADALVMAGDLFDRDLAADPDRGLAARGARRGHRRRRHRDRRHRQPRPGRARVARPIASAGRRRASTSSATASRARRRPRRATAADGRRARRRARHAAGARQPRRDASRRHRGRRAGGRARCTRQVHGDDRRARPLRAVHRGRPGRRGVGYWALGHVHLPAAGRDRAGLVVPGLPAGPPLRRVGREGALVRRGRRGRDVRRVPFHALAPVRWEVVALDDLGDVRNATEIVEQVTARFADLERRRAPCRTSGGPARRRLRPHAVLRRAARRRGRGRPRGDAARAPRRARRRRARPGRPAADRRRRSTSARRTCSARRSR